MKTKRAGQQEGETAMEYLRRCVGWCDHESAAMLDELPSVEAIIDFFDLWHEYDTDFWSGVLECIADGESSLAARSFVEKHSLPPSWSEAIQYAVDQRETTATKS
jgi:hypothetical protein